MNSKPYTVILYLVIENAADFVESLLDITGWAPAFAASVAERIIEFRDSGYKATQDSAVKVAMSPDLAGRLITHGLGFNTGYVIDGYRRSEECDMKGGKARRDMSDREHPTMVFPFADGTAMRLQFGHEANNVASITITDVDLEGRYECRQVTTFTELVAALKQFELRSGSDTLDLVYLTAVA